MNGLKQYMWLLSTWSTNINKIHNEPYDTFGNNIHGYGIDTVNIQIPSDWIVYDKLKFNDIVIK